MCRNITTLRDLEPVATEEAFERAVAIIAEATTDLIDALPPRKAPPKTEPPLRRLSRSA
jgi:hypothetical protein